MTPLEEICGLYGILSVIVLLELVLECSR